MESTANEDALLTVPELIEKYRYPVEIHQVDTPDGYILEMHRIPYGVASGAGQRAKKPVVFLQHGILCSSADWIIAGPKKGLGYLLADRDYDVWIGNTRGNTYSRRHKTLSPANGKFWDYSWHEIGIYDLPAMIDYILTNTRQTKLFYIGHSQGTTIFFVMCSQRPEYNKKIRAMFSLAPIAYMKRMTSPLLQIVAKFESIISVIASLMGAGEFLPKSSLLVQTGQLFCNDNSLNQYVCTNALFVLCGFNIKQANIELLPVIMGHSPAGASTKQLLHYAQGINSGIFRQYDYGILNPLKYNSFFPPKYDLSKVTAPVALIYSRNDWLAAEVDVLKLYAELGNPFGKFVVSDTQFNHTDYMWGRDADSLVYNQLFGLIALSKYF